MQTFLNFVNFYQRFIHEFLKIIKILIKLICKNISFFELMRIK